MAGSVTVGDASLTISAFSGRKALIAERIVRRTIRRYPEIVKQWFEFKREFERENVSTLDRSEAVFRFGPRVQHLTDADWESSGGVLRLSEAPTMNEQVAAIWPVAMDHAEDEVLRLLALCVIASGDLKRAKDAGGQDQVDKLLLERGEELLDEATDAADLAELAVVAGETLSDQFKTKASTLGPRVGKLLEAAGLKDPAPASPDPTSSETPTDGSSPEKPTSSTGSPTPTGGPTD